jgi:hypothetical protein
VQYPCAPEAGDEGIQAADDLRALGVDHPHLNWEAARTYIRVQHANALREARRLAFEILVYFTTETVGEARGARGWHTKLDRAEAIARLSAARHRPDQGDRRG